MIMTKDFKITETTASSQYGISWVLGGIAVGLLAGAVVYALMSPKTPAVSAATPGISPTLASSSPTSPSTSTLNSLEDKPVATDNRPGFSYHAVLPQLEMSVPISVHEDNPDGDTPKATAEEKKPAQKEKVTEKVAEIEASKPEPGTAVEKTSATSGGKVMFQLGAYKSEAQANQIQRLASQKGLNTRVEASEIKGERWYRVRLGPTNDPTTANRWKQMLSGMGISAMEIRL